MVVDVTTGSVLACQARSELTLDIDAFAASSAQLLRVHRMAAAQLGLADPVDEIVTSAGSSQRMLRSRLSHPDLLLLALLDKQVGNLALTRYKLMEVEQALT